jgi:ubiquinone/menaquinone biosynthesis C-methylase UbiE
MANDATDNEEYWQLDGSAPELYQRYLVPAVTAIWAADLVDRAALRQGERILDVACGTGVVARIAAERVGPRGRVAALDLNPGMLTVARSLPPVTGAIIEWQESSALALPFADAAFDVVFCQLGLQFFPDRAQALLEMRRALASGGRLALNVFGPLEHNPATHALVAALDRHIDPRASVAKRAEHALADTEQLRRLVADAGFHNLEIDTVSKLVRFPSPTDYVQIQLAATPLASRVAQYESASRERLVEAMVKDVAAALASYTKADGLTFPQEVHCARATS